MTINKFNEHYEEGDISSTIDSILDNLHKKKKLSKSEKEFMEAAAKGEVEEITLPKRTGNFWGDMANPHNIGILWIGKDGVHKHLKSVEDEDEEDINKMSNVDDRWYERNKREQQRYVEEIPELKSILDNYALELSKMEKIKSDYINKLNKLSRSLPEGMKYNFKQKIDYSTSLEKLMNNFKHIITSVKWD